MSDIFTRVVGANFLSRGRLTRSEAIAQARSHAEWGLARYTEMVAALSVPDDQLRVTVVKGATLEKYIGEAKP